MLRQLVSLTHRILTQPILIRFLCLSGLLACTTWLGLRWFIWLGPAAMALLYLLCVLCAAYISRWWLALLTACSASLLLNYCFIQPRFTLQIGSVQSWVLLLSFAVVALTVSTSVSSLKAARHTAEQARLQASALQQLVELCVACDNEAQLWQQAADFLQLHLHAPLAILGLDQDGRLNSLAGQPFDALPASAVAWGLDYARVIGAGTADWPDLPLTLYPLDSGMRLVLVTGQTQSGLVPEIAYIRLLAHTLAERGQHLRQQQARQAAEQRAAAAEFKKMLLTTLSHDMRTPLTALLGAVNLLTDDTVVLPPGQQQQLRAAIEAESAFLTLATENILTLVKLDTEAKLDSGPDQRLQADWQSPQDIARHVVERYQLRWPGRIHWQSAVGEALLYGDARLIAHALANVLDNACKFQTAGTMVTLLVEASATTIHFCVRNQGQGFPPGFQIAQWHAHHSPVQADGQRGFGLGLVIVQQIMQAHQGALTLSDQDGYTEVSLHFPLRAVT